mgnify:CR=1 FL=1
MNTKKEIKAVLLVINSYEGKQLSYCPLCINHLNFDNTDINCTECINFKVDESCYNKSEFRELSELLKVGIIDRDEFNEARVNFHLNKTIPALLTGNYKK